MPTLFTGELKGEEADYPGRTSLSVGDIVIVIDPDEVEYGERGHIIGRHPGMSNTWQVRMAPGDHTVDVYYDRQLMYYSYEDAYDLVPERLL